MIRATINYPATGFLLAVIAITFLNCGITKKSEIIEFSIIADLTEDHHDVFTELDSITVQHLLHTSDQKQGVMFRLYGISDVRYNQVYTETLPATSELELNNFERVKERNDFYRKINQDIQHMKQDMHERKQSYVFFQIAQAINDLAQSPTSSPKVLAIASDLGQHEPLFSVFNNKDMGLLKKQPEKLMEKLDATYPLHNNIGNIHLFFVHRTNTKTDQTYHLMVNFLTTYLHQKGIQDIVQVSSFEDVVIPSK